MSKIEKMPDVEVQSGSWLLLPTQETLEKRVAGGGNSKKRKRASALGNVLGRETAWWTCVGGTLEARPLQFLTTPTGTDAGFHHASCFFILPPDSVVSGPEPTAAVTGFLCHSLTQPRALGPW